MNKCVITVAAALCALTAFPALGQPGSRTAIVYGARVAGDTTWQFGSLSTLSSLNTSVTIEVATFIFRNQGVGFSTAVYKTYIDTLTTNNVSIIEDLSNGTPPIGVDGRVGVFAKGLQIQSVYTNRSASVPGSGFRISSSADTTDNTGAGGISVHQDLPADPITGAPNPNFNQDDGVLVYRFDVVASPVVFPGDQTIHVHTPVSRISGFSVFDSMTIGTTTSLKGSVDVDAIDLNISWVPSPGVIPIFTSVGLLTLGRRRRS